MAESHKGDSSVFINPKDKRKHRGKKGSVAPWIDNAVLGEIQEHKNNYEQANEYAVGVTEETAAELALRAQNMPNDIKRTIENLRPKTMEQELNRPVPEEQGYALRPNNRQWELEEIKAREKADAPPPYSVDSYIDHYTGNPQYKSRYDPTSPAKVPRQASISGHSEPDIKEKSKSYSTPKQRPEQDIKTRSNSSQMYHKINRPSKHAQGAAEKSAAQKASDLGRKKFQKEAQKKMVVRVKNTAKKTAENAKKTGMAIVRTVKSMIEATVSALGGIGLVAILAVFVVLGALLSSPLGILFSNEPTSNSVPLSSAVAQINMELNTRLMSLQSGDYIDIIVEGAPPKWTDVIAVFASCTAGTQNGVDVVQLTPDRVSKLQTVFWQMCYITSSAETLEIPDSNPDDEIDDSRLETTLTITIVGKTADQMRSEYEFTDFQNETLDILLADPAMLNCLVGNMNISQQDALELLRSLPEDLSPERRAVVQYALSLVGKVNYFWGGKSLVIGWDSRWGQLRKVTSNGSVTTGTYRPYGLDCSGFVDWVFYNASDGDYIIGHGGGVISQHGYCKQISWSETQPGDLVFYPDDSHIGIVGGRDVTGHWLIIHCASGQNNVVITDSSGFMIAGKPNFYN